MTDTLEEWESSRRWDFQPGGSLPVSWKTVSPNESQRPISMRPDRKMKDFRSPSPPSGRWGCGIFRSRESVQHTSIPPAEGLARLSRDVLNGLSGTPKLTMKEATVKKFLDYFQCRFYGRSIQLKSVHQYLQVWVLCWPTCQLSV